MDLAGRDPREDSTGDLFGRLIEDGRAYARAEVDLLKEIARHRAGRARAGLILLAGGGVLLLGAYLALVLGLVHGLATLIGPLGAGLAVAAVLAGSGYALIRYGLAGLRALGGDEEEAEAIRRGENAP